MCLEGLNWELEVRSPGPFWHWDPEGSRTLGLSLLIRKAAW